VPTALVLSAAGMFGAWQVGVWNALCERFRPEIIVGTSAGAWNGWSITGGATAEDLAREWRDPRTAHIMHRGLHASGILKPDVLYEKAQELFARYQPRIPFGLTLSEVPRLRSRLVRNAEIDWAHLAATCSIPFCFPPVRIEGRRYVDGGFLNALPLWAAEEMGATRAVAVNALTTLPFRAVRRVFPRRQPTRALEVIRIEPSYGLGTLREAFAWSAKNVDRWIALGEEDGKRAVSSITM
jgi:NTE family protein